MSLADTIVATQAAVADLKIQVTAVQAAIGALQPSGGSDTAVLAAVGALQTSVSAIETGVGTVQAALTPTPAPAA